MTVYCFGSINQDHIYTLPHRLAPGETLAASGYGVELGGKGANQSVAAALAGTVVRHIGAVGAGGADAALAAFGVDVSGVQVVAEATGHAIILLEPEGENSIVIHPGANRAIDLDQAQAALSKADMGDLLLVQNETAHVAQMAECAMGLGMEVIYSAAPFDAQATQDVLPFANILIVNAVEAAQLQAALGVPFEDLPVETVIVTKGAEGASWHARGTPEIHVPAMAVDAVDTTGAGDCFTGALAAALDEAMSPQDAMRFATVAAGVQVGRAGTAGAMPTRAEIDAALA
ncbi:MAG: ribokinase [Alphaproteobacteria bacterium]|jgi:ribokinase|nr:ribokinase [Alphaproteobacteria bacterium]